MTTGQYPGRRSIGIVTPWRDHLELAPDYFAAVETAKPDQLVVVDDGSDEPLEFAAVRIERGGFCAASNAGLEAIETDAVLFLNNDIQMKRPDWLESIRHAVEPGVAVGRLVFRNNFGVQEYPYIDGWCLGMMTKDARRIGGWDEAYDRAGPAYFSDNALSLQARLNGMTLRELLPGLHHKGGSTGGGGVAFGMAIAANRPLFEQQVKDALG